MEQAARHASANSRINFFRILYLFTRTSVWAGDWRSLAAQNGALHAHSDVRLTAIAGRSGDLAGLAAPPRQAPAQGDPGRICATLRSLCGTSYLDQISAVSSMGDWLSGRAPRSHRGGHWFDPSIAHQPRSSVSHDHDRALTHQAEPHRAAVMTWADAAERGMTVKAARPVMRTGMPAALRYAEHTVAWRRSLRPPFR